MCRKYSRLDSITMLRRKLCQGIVFTTGYETDENDNMGMERVNLLRFQVKKLLCVKLTTHNHGVISLNSRRNGAFYRSFSKSAWQERRGVVSRKTLTANEVAGTEQSHENIESRLSEKYNGFAVYENDQPNTVQKDSYEYNHIESGEVNIQSMRSLMRNKYRLSTEYRPRESGVDSHEPMQVPSETSHNIDFYGIENDSITDTHVLDKEEISTMENSYPIRTEGKGMKEQEQFDRLIELPFGTVRFDQHNVPVKSKPSFENKYKKEYQQKLVNKLLEPNQDIVMESKDMEHHHKTKQQSDLRTDTSKFSGLKFIEDQYFHFDGNSTKAKKETLKTESVSSDETRNVFEEQYFGESAMSAQDNGQFDRIASQYSNQGEENIHKESHRPFPSYTANDVENKKQISTDSETNFIEEQFFSTLSNDAKTSVTSQMPDSMKMKQSVSDKFDIDETKLQQSSISELKDITNFPQQKGLEEKTIIAADVVTKQKKRQRERIRPNLEKPTTAYDVAMKIRKEKKLSKMEPKMKENILTKPPRFVNWSGEVDSKGYRILKGQVLNLSDFTENDVVTVLKNSVLYQDDDIVAIDKPYGLPSHGGPGTHHSVGKLLPKLAERLKLPEDSLHLIHRLDKETTGVMVIGKKEDIAWKLHGMFKRREVVKKYWVLTKGIPNPTKGIIDIPMVENEIGDRYRMGLSPHYDSDTKIIYKKAKKVEKFEAITNFEVLDSNNSAALIECHPETGVKHQIRCHLAFGLNTPILGDHKYSHFTAIKPQKLYPVILEKLGIRQAKVRHLPMHLHAKSLVLPEYKDNKNIFISARLPSYFVQNMNWLKIKPPK